MNPASHTIYTVALFFALYALLSWSNRRVRRARKLRASLALGLLAGDESQR